MMKVHVIVFLTSAAQVMSSEVSERGTAPTTPPQVPPDCVLGTFACGDSPWNATFSLPYCIPPHFRCDKTYDCHDERDESNCNYREKQDGDHECKPLAYLENQVGSLWIPSEKVCDGYYDCRDHSDEQDCDKSRVSCELSEFLCEDGKQCIQKYQKCDHISDCYDNSDEKDCRSCEDKNKYCAWAATFGECKKNPGLMLENCPAACDQCKTECKNKNSNCYFWASIGECIKNPNYMLTHCKPACSQCEPYNYEDTNVDCDFWASIGECKKNPGYMLINCSKACSTSQPLNDDDYDYPLSNRV